MTITKNLSEGEWIIIGIFSAFVGWVYLALLFAPLTFIAGYKAKGNDIGLHEVLGWLLMMIATVEFLLWFRYMNSLYM